ncbi:hypothetical protein ACS0TY_015009 [Phlomoides rotata]
MRHNYESVKEVLAATGVGSSPYSHRSSAPLHTQKITIWTDASFDPHNGISSVGFVVVDTDGHFIAAGCRGINCPASIMAAELQGVPEGIKQFKLLGIHEGLFFSDSIDAVNTVRYKDHIWSPIGSIRDAILEELSDILVTHELARFARSSPGPHT